MEDEPEIITSRLSRINTRDGMIVDVNIYRGEQDSVWVLVVINQADGFTVRDETFQTEQDALNEVFQTIATEGIAAFATNPDSDFSLTLPSVANLVPALRSHAERWLQLPY